MNVTGSIADGRTETICGATGYNSFERFNVPGGITTNLHVPESARNLVNLVHNEHSFIDGTLNSLLHNGQIGGNVYFLNPHGVVVGQSGTIYVGAGISARGVDQDSDGGEVIIFADRNSYLQAGAVNVLIGRLLPLLDTSVIVFLSELWTPAYTEGCSCDCFCRIFR
ncbi:MAG: leukotoxin LktA family filamentous adhesin [Planctomycetaceae bacterium]|nr:leukotoxin LktA family filamentous adhesin [Planctomycetaceae bacterium]